jgi:hypothetical protein
MSTGSRIITPRVYKYLLPQIYRHGAARNGTHAQLLDRTFVFFLGELCMNRFLLGLVVFGAAGLMGSPGLAQKGKGKAGGGGFGWLSSLSEGKAQARKTGKPLMVVIRCVP